MCSYVRSASQGFFTFLIKSELLWNLCILLIRVIIQWKLLGELKPPIPPPASDDLVYDAKCMTQQHNTTSKLK